MRHLALIAALAGCAAHAPEVTRQAAPAPLQPGYAPPPEGADPSLCYARDRRPARIETLTQRSPTGAGPADPAGFATSTRLRIVEERRELVFEAPCPPVFTERFVATLQRALAARGLYEGPAHGRLDGATRRAVRAFQSEDGLDSAVLSMRAARRMGLVTTRLDEAGALDTDAPLLPGLPEG